MDKSPQNVVKYYAYIRPDIQTFFDIVLSTFTWKIPLRHKLELNVVEPYSLMSYD